MSGFYIIVLNNYPFNPRLLYSCTCHIPNTSLSITKVNAAGYSLGLSGPEQNTISLRKVRFAIMYNSVSEDDFTKQYQAIDNAERFILKVLARIRWDAANPDHFLYNAFIKDSVKIEPTELSLKSFGAECYLELKNSLSLKLASDDWKDIDGVCR